MSAYNRKEDNLAVWIVFSLIGVFFLVLFLFNKSAERKVDAMLASSNPSALLIEALDSRNPLLRSNAREALDQYGDPLLVALAPACKGEAVLGKPYNPDAQGPHTLVFASGKVSHDWTYEFLEDYGPASRNPQDVELVVCVAKGSNNFGTCTYQSFAKRQRIQPLLLIDIYEVTTGIRIKHIELAGGEPRQCPPFQLLSNSNAIYGKNITQDEVRELLEDYYH